jgi:cephalosporin-C deacetylase-like acetyl esterase
MRIHCWLIVGFLLTSCGGPESGAGEVSGGLEDMLTNYLTGIAERHWEERDRAIAAVRTPEEVAERQLYARSRILESFGGFPEVRAPLRARVTGVLERDGYRIEKLIYESLPEFYVTANVYVPMRATPPYPAVLIAAGHGWSAKAGSSAQQIGGSLAQRGILALAYDPIGQGERLEYFDPEQGRSLAGRGPTFEHMMADWQCRLTGGNFARYEIWDGIRAVDYLIERGDVDPERIGVAGNSGGGTQAAFLAALEPRLAAAVVVCYMTNWRTLWAGPGPQDAEQSPTSFISDGLDFGDLKLLFAPRPFHTVAGTLDYFPLEGARATAAEARRLFGILGRPEAAGFLEDPGHHGYLRNRREETVRWMQRWLNDRPDDPGTEPAIELEPEESLYCTPTGQLSMSLGGLTVHLLNRDLAERQYADRTANRVADAATLRAVIAERIKTTVPLDRERPLPPATRRGGETREGYRIENIALETEKGITVPALVLVPESGEARKPAVLFVNSAGKTAGMTLAEGRDDWHRWDPEVMAEAGYVVMAPDLRGWGESSPRHAMNPGSSGYSIQYQTAQRALLVGRTLVGMQVDDLLRSFDYLASRSDVDPERISLFGKGDGGTVGLYAAALEPRIQKVVSEGALSSYRSVARWKYHDNVERLIVPGVLKDFDLPDVAAAIAPRTTWIVSPLTPTRMAAPLEGVSEEYGPAKASFERAGRGDHLRFLRRVPGALFTDVYGPWLTR